ncbi:sulfurtransferase [Homoserinibacter gongjuensis]|uniref:sulfurtransferase n=1 Tax=Homoserinibacter gongjuensis TaxID=1162968 RepID=UPI003D67BAA8
MARRAARTRARPRRADPGRIRRRTAARALGRQGGCRGRRARRARRRAHLLDAPKEFTGEFAPRARAGHIPGSSSVPAAFLVDREHNTVLDPEGLRARFEPALGAPRIITYCAGGIAAAASAFALTLLGERSVAIYDGSLNEWAADPEAPLVTA